MMIGIDGLVRRMERCQKQLETFRREEQGSMVLFGVLMLILMLAIAGMAVDIMRSEYTRVQLQNTLDRSVLAAADLEQTLDPEAVVRDYFEKAGVTQYLKSVRVIEGYSSREVTADAFAVVPTIFMGMIGINEMPTPASGQAQEAVKNVEIALVLDLSYSMNSNNRLPNLKIAARDFIDAVLGNQTAQDLVSVTIVPYTGQVHAGPELLSYYNVGGPSTFGHCINHAGATFSNTSVSQSSTLVRSHLFDPWFTSRNLTMTYCPRQPSQEVVVYSSDPVFLKNRISSFIADGNTSMEIGMKWGVATLDPSFNSILAGYIAKGHVNSEFSDRPFAWNQQDTKKFIVVMSDGENTSEFTIKSPYNTGMSPVYRRNSNGNLSIWHASKNQYWLNSSSAWATSPDGGLSANTQLTWPQVWAEMPVRYYANRLVAVPLGGTNTYNNTVNAILGSTAPSTKNTRTQQICTAAKNNGVTVFSIAFEAPPVGVTTLQNCASSINHFFDVNGTDIGVAFQEIAREINKLRLTL